MVNHHLHLYMKYHQMGPFLNVVGQGSIHEDLNRAYRENDLAQINGPLLNMKDVWIH